MRVGVLNDLDFARFGEPTTVAAVQADPRRFEALVAPADWLPALRAIVGPEPRLVGVPTATALTQAMIAAADAIVNPDQLPHVLEAGVQPVTAAVPLPLAWHESMRDAAAFREVLDFASEQRGLALIAANAFVLGEAGVVVLVVADGDDTYARNSADDLASALWERRERIAAEVSDQKRPSRPRAAPDAFAAWEPGREDGVFYGVRRGLSRA